MQCPKCYEHNRISNIRAVTTRTDLDNNIIRRRACNECGHRWYTVEVEVPAVAIAHGRCDKKLRTTFELKGTVTWNQPEDMQ